MSHALLEWENWWPEALSLLLLVIGFIMAVLLHNSFLNYLMVLLAGFLAARVYYSKRFTEPILPFIMIIIGFLIGYLLGSFWASRIWSFIFFSLGFGVSYYLHMKKILVIFKSKPYIK